MNIEKFFSCCFTGHREIEKNERLLLEKSLVSKLEELIQKGVTNFYAGGSLGFDSIAAKKVLEMKKLYPRIKLHLILPCRRSDCTATWKPWQINEFDRIMSKADSVEFISDKYYEGCKKERNIKLVKCADICLCYQKKETRASETAQTVRMARDKAIQVINLA